MQCSSLPDPENERDLTTFITIWKESKDSLLKECAQQCQVAEDVIREMQNILGEAISNYNHEKIEWCNHYTNNMREIIMEKFDAITAFTLEYIENHTKIPQEELEKLKNTLGGKRDQ